MIDSFAVVLSLGILAIAVIRLMRLEPRRRRWDGPGEGEPRP